MENRIEFSRLKTLDEVRRAKMSVRFDIERKKDRLQNDFDRVGEVLSGDYILGILAEKSAGMISKVTSGISSRIRSFSSGFSLLSNLAGMLGNRFGLGKSRKRYEPREPFYVVEEYFGEPEEEEAPYEAEDRYALREEKEIIC